MNLLRLYYTQNPATLEDGGLFDAYYAKGIRAAFVGYLEERLDYLAVTDDEDDPELLRYVEVIRKRLDNAKKMMLD